MDAGVREVHISHAKQPFILTRQHPAEPLPASYRTPFPLDGLYPSLFFHSMSWRVDFEPKNLLEGQQENITVQVEKARTNTQILKNKARYAVVYSYVP